MPFLAPVFTAVSAFAASSVVAGFIVNTAISIGLSALSTALFGKKPEQNRAGILSDVTTAGGTNPQTIILGYCATNGNRVAPYYSHGYDDDTDNEWLTAIIDLADLPIDGIESVIVDGNDYSILAQRNPGDGNYNAEHDYYGQPLSGKLQDWARFRFHDGTQTTADAKLVERSEYYPERPWTADHILEGIPYAVMSYRTDPKKEDPVWQGFPEARFVVRGSKLYDPRKDSTVAGGSGSHRWGNKNTWEFTDNPIVMVYNIIRGIELPDGSVYGIGANAASLPLDKWFAAMNVCDEPGTQTGTNWKQDIKRYRAGLEFTVDSEPNDIILTILKSCGGRIAEYGGYYTVSVGAPALPSASFDDGVIIDDQQRSFDMCAGLNGMFNGVSANYPSPKHKWETSDAVPYHNATWEAEDDGRRLVADMKLASVPFERQVRRLMRELAKDNRRQRQHLITLGPWAMPLLPLDTIRWTSETNGYIDKDFEITGKQIDPRTLNVTLNIRERDPADYDADAVFDAITPDASSNVMVVPTINGVKGLTVTAFAIGDEDGNPRRPAILIGWNGNAPYDGVSYQVRLVSTEEIVTEGTVIEVERGQKVVSSGILPNTNYEVRARAVKNGRNRVWSSWIPVTTASLYLTNDDFEDGIRKLFEDQGMYGIQYGETKPTIGNRDGQYFFDTGDGKLYQWDEATSQWVSVIDRELASTDFASGINIPRVVDNLPATGELGQLVTYSADGKLYRWNGTEWVSGVGAVSAEDIDGSLTSDQIESVEAAKIIGQLVSEQLAAASITPSKLKTLPGANLLPDPLMEDEGSWSVQHPEAWTRGPGSWTYNGGTTANQSSVFAQDIAVRPEYKYQGKINVQMVTGTTTQVRAIWQWLDVEKNILSTQANAYTTISDNNPIIDTAIRAPANANVRYLRFGFNIRPSLTDGTVRFSELDLQQIVNSDLIDAAAITETKIANNAITTPKLVAGVITADKLASNSVVASKIEAGAITAIKIAADQINSNHLVSGAVTTDKLSANSIIGSHIVGGTITGDLIAANTLTANNLTANIISSRELSADSVNTNHLMADSITAAKVSAGAIGVDQLAANAVTANKIAANTITGSKIVAETIHGGLLETAGIITTSAQIGNGLIETAHIRNAQIDKAKIANAAVGTAEIENLAVNTFKIRDRSVSTWDYAYTGSRKSSPNSGWTEIQRVVLNKGRQEPMPLFFQVDFPGKGTIRLQRSTGSGWVTLKSWAGQSQKGRPEVYNGISGDTITYIDRYTGTGRVVYRLLGSSLSSYQRISHGSSGSEYDWRPMSNGYYEHRFLGMFNVLK
ncbi:phage tail protein [Paracoccus sp. (in: a-proteobacteria)]|uniref:phage tail protein n=1 Tax=Paracoccus sp. TaxID=267 RepID=UPI0040589792